MKYIDVRIRIPVNKMGPLIEDVLPEWATMVGYDRLTIQPEKRKYRTNGRADAGGYKPGKGTAAESVMRVLNQPMRPMEIIKKLIGKQKHKAVNSAVHNLAHKGLITKNEDGTYERA